MAVLEEPCASGIKHYSPFRCEVVPKSFIIELIKQYPKLCKIAFFDEHIVWMKRMSFNRYSNRQVSKSHVFSPANRKITEIFQRILNYEKSTISGQHIHYRVGRVYREYIDMDWHRDHNGDWEFTWDEEKLNSLINNL